MTSTCEKTKLLLEKEIFQLREQKKESENKNIENNENLVKTIDKKNDQIRK